MYTRVALIVSAKCKVFFYWHPLPQDFEIPQRNTNAKFQSRRKILIRPSREVKINIKFTFQILSFIFRRSTSYSFFFSYHDLSVSGHISKTEYWKEKNKWKYQFCSQIFRMVSPIDKVHERPLDPLTTLSTYSFRARRLQWWFSHSILWGTRKEGSIQRYHLFREGIPICRFLCYWIQLWKLFLDLTLLGLFLTLAPPARRRCLKRLNAKTNNHSYIFIRHLWLFSIIFMR